MQYFIGLEPKRKNARKNINPKKPVQRYFGDKFYRDLVNVAIEHENVWVSTDWPTTGEPRTEPILLNRNHMFDDIYNIGTLEVKRFYSTLFVRFVRHNVPNKPAVEPEHDQKNNNEKSIENPSVNDQCLPKDHITESISEQNDILKELLSTQKEILKTLKNFLS